MWLNAGFLLVALGLAFWEVRLYRIQRRQKKMSIILHPGESVKIQNDGQEAIQVWSLIFSEEGDQERQPPYAVTSPLTEGQLL